MPESGQPENAARAALRTDESTRALAEAPFEVVPGGLSNHAWIAHAPGGDFFVRLSPADSARLGVDRASECELLGIVARAGLSPAVVRCDPSQRLLVTQCVDGKTLAREEAVEPRCIRQLARNLRELHGLPVPPGMRRVVFSVQAINLESQCPGNALVHAEMRDRARTAFAMLARGGRADTLCHNDLHHLNLMQGGRLWLVDWEYGGAGDPLFDLASFLTQHDCGARERDLLLDAYGAGSAVEPHQLDAACWVFDYVQWLWYRAWPAGEDADPVYRDRADALERRLRGLTGAA